MMGRDTGLSSPARGGEKMWGLRRRDLLVLLGGAAATLPFAARAQQPAMPVIGFLHSASLEPNVNFVEAFRKGLAESGFTDGRNVAIEFRWANGQLDQLPDLAADLVRRNVALIATPGSSPAAFAAKDATKAIPIIFAIGADPVALGLVASLNRPGGNITGVNFEATAIGAKALGMFREIVPRAERFAVIVNPAAAFTAAVIDNMREGAATLGLQVEVLHASTESEIEAAFAAAAQQRGTALLLGPDPFYTSHRVKIVAMAERYAVPAMYILREFAEAGGLVSYGPDLTNAYRETGAYAARILKGEKPADLPVVLPTKFDLVINGKTAKTLNLTVPDRLLAIADEVIE
jgi:putative tryptophan/tyrosine transport system substrate-binding protein